MLSGAVGWKAESTGLAVGVLVVRGQLPALLPSEKSWTQGARFPPVRAAVPDQLHPHSLNPEQHSSDHPIELR